MEDRAHLGDADPFTALVREMDGTPFTFEMAPWVKDAPEVDTEHGGTPPTQFERDRANLLELLERFTRRPREFEWQPHPMFGTMSDRDWMRWGYLHMDHHLRQFGK